MVISRLNKIIILSALILYLGNTLGLSQGTDLSRGKKSRLWAGISVSPGISTISNSNSTTITGLSSEGKSTVSFTGEAGFMFSDYFGISTGIGYGSLKSEILMATYNRAPYDTFDATESYKRSITGSNIKEIQQISFLKIPLLLNIKIPLGKSLELYFNPGVNFSLPVTKKYAGSGTFSYDGFYSAYNVHITGVPYEGLEKDYSTSDEGGLLIKSINAGLTASAGVHYSIQEKVQIGIGFAYEKLLSDISDYADAKDFTLSSKPNQMRSIMEGSSGATASSVGLKISVRILL